VGLSFVLSIPFERTILSNLRNDSSITSFFVEEHDHSNNNNDNIIKSIVFLKENEVIEENRKRDKWRKLTFPFLQNTVLYYFSVSAYDSYKPDTRYNHESEFSKTVSARPFMGSEIK